MGVRCSSAIAAAVIVCRREVDPFILVLVVLTMLAGTFGDIVAGAVAGSVTTQACLPRL